MKLAYLKVLVLSIFQKPEFNYMPEVQLVDAMYISC